MNVINLISNVMLINLHLFCARFLLHTNMIMIQMIITHMTIAIMAAIIIIQLS